MSYDGMNRALVASDAAARVARIALDARARVERLLGPIDRGAAFSAPMRAPRSTVGGQGSEAPSVNR
jgi:hypothetical protein